MLTPSFVSELGYHSSHRHMIHGPPSHSFKLFCVSSHQNQKRSRAANEGSQRFHNHGNGLEQSRIEYILCILCKSKNKTKRLRCGIRKLNLEMLPHLKIQPLNVGWRPFSIVSFSNQILKCESMVAAFNP